MEATQSMNLDAAFAEHFGGAPTHAVWSPGRVNLIGEHTDYNFLPVLPMAIGRGFSMRIRKSNSSRIRVRNINPEFPAIEFDGSDSIPKSPTGEWSNYVKAAVQTIWPLIREKRGECFGFDAVLSSNLPPASGLSSSSALVVGSYTALAAANDTKFDAMEAADLMCRAEKYTGTAGGGMDQATIVLGRRNCALMIGFEPLTVQEVPLPEGIIFFAIDSQQRAAKTGSVRFEYNRRVFECNIGMRLLARQIEKDGYPTLERALAPSRWQSLRDAYEFLNEVRMPFSKAVLKAIGTETWTFERLRSVLGSDVDQLLAQKQMPPADAEIWSAFHGFHVYGRVMHVLEETSRVHRCVSAFQSGNLSEALLDISLSHMSCRDLYHISTPELEDLVSSALKSGALAARITGAGFGGSIVAVVKQENADAFRQGLWERYFMPRIASGAFGQLERDAVIIDCESGPGAYAWSL